MVSARLDLRRDAEIKFKAEETSSLVGRVSYIVIQKKYFL